MTYESRRTKINNALTPLNAYLDGTNGHYTITGYSNDLEVTFSIPREYTLIAILKNINALIFAWKKRVEQTVQDYLQYQTEQITDSTVDTSNLIQASTNMKTDIYSAIQIIKESFEGTLDYTDLSIKLTEYKDVDDLIIIYTIELQVIDKEDFYLHTGVEHCITGYMAVSGNGLSLAADEDTAIRDLFESDEELERIPYVLS